MAVVVLLAAGGLWVVLRKATSALVPWFAYQYSSDSLDPLDVWLGKTNQTHLRIPRAYIAALSEERGKVGSFVHITAFLPDMTPRVIFEKQLAADRAKRDPAAIAQYGEHWLYIEINPNLMLRADLDRMISYAREHYALVYNNDEMKYRVYRDEPFGKSGPDDFYKFATWEYYIPNTSDYYIDCNGKHTTSYLCHLRFVMLNSKVRVEVLFKPENSQFESGDLVFKPTEMTPDQIMDKAERIEAAVSSFLRRIVVQ